jgi:hypothetical protein
MPTHNNTINEFAPTDNSRLIMQPEYYGKWKVNKAYKTGTISTLSLDDINKVIGKVIIYSPDSAIFENDKCNKPFYKEMIYSQEKFESESKTNFDDLDIMAETVTGVEIYTDEKYKNIWDNMADSFFVKDKNTLILFYEGTYFELARIE